MRAPTIIVIPPNCRSSLQEFVYISVYETIRWTANYLRNEINRISSDFYPSIHSIRRRKSCLLLSKIFYIHLLYLHSLIQFQKKGNKFDLEVKEISIKSKASYGGYIFSAAHNLTRHNGDTFGLLRVISYSVD